MTPRHLLIDLDGTISDSSPGIGRSLHTAFETCGYGPPSDDQIRSAIGPPLEMTLPSLGVAADDVERLIEAYRLRYEDVGLYENEMYDGIADLIEALAGTHVLSVATAKPEATARRIIQHFGLDGHFAAVVGAAPEVGGGRRTKAQVIAHALRALGVDGGPHVLMIGDRDHDVDGARANGLACIGVTWGFGSRDELSAAGPVTLVDRPGEVGAAVQAAYRAGIR